MKTPPRSTRYTIIAIAAVLVVAGAVWAGFGLLGKPEQEAMIPSADTGSKTPEGTASATPDSSPAASASPDASASTGTLDQPTEAELSLTYDTVVQGGRVINPETKLDREGVNVAIQDGRIALVTDQPLKGKRIIDAKGLVVAPGFIDNLSYDPNPLGVWNKIADGVTSNIAMHGGTDTPLKWYPYYAKAGTPVHYGASYFYTKARNKLLIALQEPADDQQIKELVKEAEKALNDGVLGISFSLEYVPGIGASEIVPLMKLAYKYNVPVYFHARYSDMEEPGTNIDAINEIIGYAKETGAMVHLDHINSTGGTFSMKESLGLLEKAREEGIDITSCTYPYDYWGTYLNSARFAEGWQERFHITYKDLQIAGTNDRLTEATFGQYKKEGKLAVAFAIPEQDIIDSLSSPFVMIGSDAILEPGNNNHPRASGTFARTIGLYTREHHVMSLIDAISKMTLMPAERLEKQVPAMRKKGRIARGMDADLVVFDYNTINDRSTVEKPEIVSTGIKYVLIDGQVALDGEGLHKNVRVGEPIRSEFTRVSKKSTGTLTIGGDAASASTAPAVEYRGQAYADSDSLKLLGYQADLDTKTHALKLAAGGSVPATAGSDTAKGPVVGELMLERGHLLTWDGGQAEMLSIGDKDYVPLAALKSLGWRVEKTGTGWKADKS